MNTAAPRELGRRDSALLFFGASGSAVAWALHLLVGYGYEEAACDNRWAIPSVEWVIIGLTVVLGAVGAASGIAALRSWRAVRAGRLPDPRGRVAFMATFGLVGAPLFLAMILFGGLMLLLLDPCVQT